MRGLRDDTDHLGVSPAHKLYARFGDTDAAHGIRDEDLRLNREYTHAPPRPVWRGHTGKIGLLINTSVSYMADYMAEVMIGMMLSAEPHGLNVVTYNSTINGGDALQRICRAREIDGAILIWSAGIDAAMQTLTRERIPFVVLGRRVSDPRITWIAPDNFRGAHLAILHLIALGHQRIGFMARAEMGATNTDRLAGYCAALNDERIGVDESLIVPTYIEPDSGYQAMHLLLDRPNPPTAVFAFDDTIALDAARAAMDRGLNVPRDIAIVGFDGLRTSMISKPPLTTVGVPLQKMSGQAVEMLLERIQQPDAPVQQHTVPVSLIVRASTIGE